MPARPEPKWLTVREVAEELGIAEVSVRKLIHAGKLPAYRPTTVTLRVRVEDLDNYMNSRPVAGPAALRDGRRGGKKPGPRVDR